MGFERYCRQINLIGEESQQILLQSSVLIVGAGGIGSPLLMYLVTAGIGKIGVIDSDKVDLSNLHRQILFNEDDLGKFKAIIAVNKLRRMNSAIDIQAYNCKLQKNNAEKIISNYDLIIDCSDNFKTRYLINDICCSGKPLISSSIFQNLIYLMFIDTTTGCYRCAFPEPPPPNLMSNCSDMGIIGASAGIAGSMAAKLAIQYFTNRSSLPKNKIIGFDSDNMVINHHNYNKNTSCLSCVHRIDSWPAIDYGMELSEINLDDFIIIDVRECHEDRQVRLSINELHIPFSQIQKEDSLFSRGEYLLYCQTGSRSDYASFLLQKKGIQAFSLKRGVQKVNDARAP